MFLKKRLKKKKVEKPFIIFEMPNYNHLLTFLSNKAKNNLFNLVKLNLLDWYSFSLYQLIIH